jgi:hypothetical protein
MDRYRKQGDEWGQIMQKQGQINRMREEEEKVMALQNKLSYKANLDYM